MSSPKVLAAELEAAAARAQVQQTLEHLQARLNPKVLARGAARDIADTSSAVATAGLDTARRNPGAIAGITAVAGLFLARHRIAGLFGRKSDT